MWLQVRAGDGMANKIGNPERVKIAPRQVSLQQFPVLATGPAGSPGPEILSGSYHHEISRNKAHPQLRNFNAADVLMDY